MRKRSKTFNQQPKRGLGGGVAPGARQREIIKLFGTVKFAPDFDYNAERVKR